MCSYPQVTCLKCWWRQLCALPVQPTQTWNIIKDLCGTFLFHFSSILLLTLLGNPTWLSLQQHLVLGSTLYDLNLCGGRPIFGEFWSPFKYYHGSNVVGERILHMPKISTTNSRPKPYPLCMYSNTMPIHHKHHSGNIITASAWNTCKGIIFLKGKRRVLGTLLCII